MLARTEFDFQMAKFEQGRHEYMVAVVRIVALRAIGQPRRLSLRKRYCPRISGSPFLLLPITTTLELALLARFSVASIPFHSSKEGVMPWATICWKSRTPAASMRLRWAS